MSPEELEAAREGANVDYAPDISYDDWQAMARALLAHIDSQAVTINNLAAALDEAKVDQVNFSSACQEELDTQAAQIATMKEKLHHERVAYLRAVNSYHKKDGLEYVAREQLKAEMPEVEW